jgi:LEA14-like dessication related protein
MHSARFSRVPARTILPRAFFSRMLLVLGVGVLVAACGMQRKRDNLKNCKFTFEDVTFETIGLTEIKFRLKMGLENPNEEEVVLDRMDFEVVAENREIARGQQKDGTAIGPGEKKPVEISFVTSPMKLGAGLLSTVTTLGKADWRVKGIAYVDFVLKEVAVPFDLPLAGKKEEPDSSLELVPAR